MTDQIATIRADLAAWSERQAKRVQRAVLYLDGWLAAAADPHPDAETNRVNVLACTARAVETLRRAVRGSVLSAYGRSDG